MTDKKITPADIDNALSNIEEQVHRTYLLTGVIADHLEDETFSTNNLSIDYSGACKSRDAAKTMMNTVAYLNDHDDLLSLNYMTIDYLNGLAESISKLEESTDKLLHEKQKAALTTAMVKADKQ